MQPTTSTQGWHVANWGTLGWLETGVKAVGIVAGLLAFAASSGDFVLGGNPNLAAVIICALFCLVTLGALFMRIRQQEIVSLVYAIFNALGHFGMLIALLRVPADQTLPLIFGIAYIVGELVKQRFLAVSGYTEGGQTTAAMINLSRGVAAFYLIFVVLILV